MPFMAVGKADRQVGARSLEMQRGEALAVQPGGALVQVGIVLGPGGDRIGDIDARGGEDRLGELGDRDRFRIVREDLLRPGRVRIGDDVPVDVEIGDLLQRRLVGGRIGAVGACRPWPGPGRRAASDCRRQTASRAASLA